MHPRKRDVRRLRRVNKREGTAVMEFAVCLPILVILVLASIEASNIVFLKQALTHAGYEAARVAAHRSTRNGEPEALANQILAARNIQASNVVVNPSDIESLSRGSNIIVSVTAPSDSNSLVPMTQFGGHLLSVSMRSVKN